MTTEEIQEKRAAEQEARFESALERRQPRLFAVPCLAAMNVLVWILFSVATGGWLEADSKLLIGWGANYGISTLDGQWWRLMSAAFLHSGLPHLAINLLTLVDFGSRCERFYGSGPFVFIYLMSALAGSAASLMWDPLVISVGASGAIMGIVGAAFVYTLDDRNDVPVSVFKQHALSLGMFAFYTISAAWDGAPIDHAAHFGGLVMGAIAGATFLAGGDWNAQPRSQQLRTSGYLLIYALCVAGVVAVGGFRLDEELDNRIRDRVANFDITERTFREDMERLLPRLEDPQTHADTVAVLVQRRDAMRQEYEALIAYPLKEGSRWIGARTLLIELGAMRRDALTALVKSPALASDAKTRVVEFRRRIDASNEIAGRIRITRDAARRPI